MIESLQINKLYDIFCEGRLAHAFLFESNDCNKCCKDLIQLVKKIMCPSEYNCNCPNECNVCQLIDRDSLSSFIFVNSSDKVLKKDSFEEIINRFTKRPILTDYNVYIVNNASRMNSFASNAILKFLEEPYDNVIGFFVTNNLNTILPTIKSRCQIISCNYDLDKSKDYLEFKDDINFYFDKICKGDGLIYNKKLLSKFKERIEYEKFFTAMMYYVLDCIENNLLINECISYNNMIDVLSLIKRKINGINYNVNVNLIFDSFVIEMSGLYE